MSEMIERVAKAIYDDNKFVKPWEKSPCWHAVCRRHARAAIEAMREPSEDMLDAADEPFHDEWRKQKSSSLKTYGREGYGSSTFSSRIWQAMIDEVLK